MAPKKKELVNKKKDTAKKKAYDAYHFTSPEAFKRFRDGIASKNLIAERGFAVAYGLIFDNIQSRGWQKFAAKPEAAIISLVREFYSNALEANDAGVFVRDERVPFDAATINRVYGLPDIVDDDYSKIMNEDTDWDKVIRRLTKAGTAWRLTRSAAPKDFPASALTREGKAWNYFICARLLPSTQYSEVTRERAGLMYAIMAGKSVDVGQIIHLAMLKVIRGTTTVGLAFPSLISTLCNSVRVDWETTEEQLLPLRDIDRTVMLSYQSWEDDSDAVGDHYDNLDPSTSGPTRVPGPPRSPRRTRPRTTPKAQPEEPVAPPESSYMRDLRTLHHEFRQQAAWQNDSMLRLAQMIGQHVGAPQPWLAPPPVFPPFQSPPGDDDDDSPNGEGN